MTISVKKDGVARLTVRDDGAGIDDETKTHIFEPFFTTKAKGAGSGLGLSTVDGIVAQSGGSISVESEPGCGRAFTIVLPLTEEPFAELDGREGAQPKQAREGEPPHSPTGLVLLVEDEELVRSVTVEMLRRLGYEVVAAACGEEALERLASDGLEVDLLVTDVVMTGMDGPTLAQHAHELRPSLPVLFISGYSADALNAEQLAAVGADLLGKPFTPSTLAERIETARRRLATAA